MIAYSKRTEKIIPEKVLEQKKKKPGLKFSPELALIGLRTTGHRVIKTADSLDHLVVNLGTVDLGSIPGRTLGVYSTFYADRIRP